MNYICTLCYKSFSNTFNLKVHTNHNTCPASLINPDITLELTNNQHILEVLDKKFWKNIYISWNILLDKQHSTQYFGWKHLQDKVQADDTLSVSDLVILISQLLPNIHPKYLRQKLHLYVLKSKLSLDNKTIFIHTIHKLKLFLNYNLTSVNRTWNGTKVTTLLCKL